MPPKRMMTRLTVSQEQEAQEGPANPQPADTPGTHSIMDIPEPGPTDEPTEEDSPVDLTEPPMGDPEENPELEGMEMEMGPEGSTAGEAPREPKRPRSPPSPGSLTDNLLHELEEARKARADMQAEMEAQRREMDFLKAQLAGQQPQGTASIFPAVLSNYQRVPRPDGYVHPAGGPPGGPPSSHGGSGSSHTSRTASRASNSSTSDPGQAARRAEKLQEGLIKERRSTLPKFSGSETPAKVEHFIREQRKYFALLEPTRWPDYDFHHLSDYYTHAALVWFNQQMEGPLPPHDTNELFDRMRAYFISPHQLENFRRQMKAIRFRKDIAKHNAAFLVLEEEVAAAGQGRDALPARFIREYYEESFRDTGFPGTQLYQDIHTRVLNDPSISLVALKLFATQAFEKLNNVRPIGNPTGNRVENSNSEVGPRRDSRSEFRGTCFKCGKKNHRSRECRGSPAPAGEAARKEWEAQRSKTGPPMPGPNPNSKPDF